VQLVGRGRERELEQGRESKQGREREQGRELKLGRRQGRARVRASDPM